MYIKRYCIAGITLQLESDQKIEGDPEFSGFETDRDPVYIIYFRKVSSLSSVRGTPVVKRLGISIYKDNPYCEFRFEGLDHEPYAVSRRKSTDRRITVEYLETGSENICHSRGAFFHIGWEEMLLRNNRLILHACCVASPVGGILFSGRSGIGKSTQGGLWCRYEQAKVINEDRPILYKQDGKWIACGSPYAGSSRYHVNEHTQVRAIVMLEQAQTCEIRRLCRPEAFRRIYAQTTGENWNPESVQYLCNLAEQLILDVPVYELACTPDKEAVDTLREVLLRG